MRRLPLNENRGQLGPQLALPGCRLENMLYLCLALHLGHREGGQPVPHPDFENQRFPSTVRRYLGGPGPPFPADLGASGGSGPESTVHKLIASRGQLRLPPHTAQIFARIID